MTRMYSTKIIFKILYYAHVPGPPPCGKVVYDHKL